MLVRGAGPPVVLLHASGMGAGQWGPLLPRLAERWTVYAPDLLGYGESSAASEPYSVEQDVDAVVALLRELGEPAHLVGHSFGGLVALGAAARTEVRSLAVFEPVAFGIIAAEGVVDPGLLNPSLLTFEGGGEGWLAAFIDYWGGEGAWETMGSRRKEALALTARKSWLEVSALLAECRADFDVRARTLVMCAGRSPPAARAIAERLVVQLPNARLQVFLDSGHMAPVEEARRFLRILLAWFDEA